MSNLFLNFVKITGCLPYGAYLKPRIYRATKGQKILPGPEIVAANHTSLMDFPMLLFLYPFKPLRVLMAEVLYKRPVNAWIMEHLRGIRIDRNDPIDGRYMTQARQALMEGNLVVFFPEGKLNPAGKDFGPLLPFHKGSVYLAITSGISIRPVYFHTNGGLFKRSSILYGEPIPVQELFGSQPTAAALEAANQHLKRAMESLRDSLKIKVKRE